jgi:hypothetical protein
MIKNLHKYFFGLLVLFTTSVHAQVAVVDENFQSWTQQGYATYTDCETNTIANGTIVVTKTYASGQVTYTLDSTAVNPTCNYRTGGTNATCLANTSTSNGYVYLDKDGGTFTTSPFANVTTVDLKLSYTGSYRQATLQKSTDGVNWTSIYTAVGSSCSQYGETFANIPVNDYNVSLRIIPALSNHPTNPPALNHVRVHDLKVYGTIVAGVNNNAWAESGITASVKENILTVTSENIAGFVDVISLTGVSMNSKEIQKDGEVTFVIPASGLYIVRVNSGNKVYNKKVAVN